MYPYVDADGIASILASFEKNVNFWYPTMSQSQLDRIRITLEDGVPAEDTVQCCLALLTMALGCVSQAVTRLRSANQLGDYEEDKQKRIQGVKMAHVYFQLALKKLHIIHLEVSSESTQCLFFTA